MLIRLLKFLKIPKNRLDYTELRIYEIIPGLLIWVTFILALSLSIFKPLWAIYFVIVLDVYWVIRIWYLFVYLIISWCRYIKAMRVDWRAKVQQFSNWQDYIHLITLPTYKEPYEVVKNTFDKLLESDYPQDKMIIVLGGEERDQNNFLKIAERIKLEYSNKFRDLLITVHPQDLPDEIPGKGSNMHHMGRKAAAYFQEKDIDYSRVIISMFDIETWPDPHYFDALTYHYLSHDRPENFSYQPLVLFNNNIWRSNILVRVVASSTTFWLLTDMSRSERLFTFSSHSMSFNTLVKVGFHPKGVVTEDTRIFLNCLNYFNGDYQAQPIFVPVSMQTVDIGNVWASFKNQYIQIRRWGWGVEHFPWMMLNLFKNKKISWKKKFRYLWNQTEGVYTWATLPILILFLGYFPIWVADMTIHYNVLIHNAPQILERVMNFGLAGIIFISFLNTGFLPPKPKDVSWIKYPLMILQWVLFPISMIVFGSIPSAEAQTRLMLGGKYRLGFQVTKKK